MLKAGHKVTDNLTLERLVGEGAMGSVWVAHHAGLDTRVAVKFIARDHREDAQKKLLHRFEREAKAAAKIKSPHVVHMYDHGVMDGGVPYIVMELLEGETLGHRLRREGALDLELLGEVMKQVGKALAGAHEHGIVHRDIKPDNIFLVPAHGEILVKVLDFGIAKHVEEEHSMTTTGAMLGTPLYMSPELIRSSRNATPSADLWALAVVIYEALTGRPPFQGETVGALFFSICGDSADAPSNHRTGIAPALDAWFSKALCQEMDLRYPDARTMAVAFAEAAATTSELGAPAAPPPAVDATLGTAEFLSQQSLDDKVRSDAKDADSEAPTSTVDIDEPSDDGPKPEPEPAEASAPPLATDVARPKRGRWIWAAAALAAASAAAWLSLSEAPAPPAIAAPAAAEPAKLTPLTIACKPVCDSVLLDGRTHRRVDFALVAEQHGLEPSSDELRVAIAPGEHVAELSAKGYETRRTTLVVAEEPMHEEVALVRSTGKLAAGVIEDVLKQSRPLFDTCHRDALKNAVVYGKLDVAFVIGLDGKVVEVAMHGDIRDKDLLHCLERSYSTLAFPAPDDGFVEAKHQLVLAPPKPADQLVMKKKQAKKGGYDLDNYLQRGEPPVQQQQQQEPPVEQRANDPPVQQQRSKKE